MSPVTEFRSREAQAFREGLGRPEVVQERFLLEQVVRPNEACEFGRRHDFAAIRTVEDYRRAVPVARYEAFDAAIERIVQGEQGVLTTAKVKRFFLTSGSTAKAKYIPVTSALVRNKSRAFGIYWSAVFEDHPATRGAPMVTNFSDSGAPVLSPGGLPCSSESAFWAGVTRATMLDKVPIIPEAVARIGDADARYYAIARILLEAPFKVVMTLNPSTLLLLFQSVDQHAAALIDDVRRGGIAADLPVGDDVRHLLAARYPGNPQRAAELAELASTGRMTAHRIWPALQLAISWRSPMLQPYLDLLAPHLGPVAGRDYILMASEGVMAIPLRDGTSGGPLAIGVHFFEFIPEEQYETASPDVLLPHELEVGRRYVVVLTNGSGLYRYDIGDVVRAWGFEGRTPCIEFLHRVGATCSLTGEKLTEDQVTAAMRDVVAQLGLEVTSFTLVPAKGGFPRYVLLVELAADASDEALTRLPGLFDAALDRRNVEYGSKRSSRRLGAPEAWIVERGSYDERRRQRLAGGTSDSQIKPTHLTRDPSFVEPFVVLRTYTTRDP